MPTEDADITPDLAGVDLARLAATLRELNTRIRTESVPEGLSPLATTISTPGAAPVIAGMRPRAGSVGQGAKFWMSVLTDLRKRGC